MRRNHVTIYRCILLAAGMLSFGPTGWTTPYASGLANNAGTITFRLNESADNVKVISADGATTNDLGALAGGMHSFPLAISGTYQVQVFKVSRLGYTSPIAPNQCAVLQTSSDNDLVRFNDPRGLDVNTDPTSPYFGRVYIANASATNSPRAVGDGIYVLNSDLSDALGQGDTPLTGGLDFTSPVSPYRLSIGEDNNLYISDWSETTGSLYVTDPNVSVGSGQNVLGGPAGGPFPVTSERIHGSISGIAVLGSLAAGNLRAYVVDEDLQIPPDDPTPFVRQSLWRHDIGSSFPGPFVMPTGIAVHPRGRMRMIGGQVMDLARGTNGLFYVSNYRSAGEEVGVWVLDTDGIVLFNSMIASSIFAGVPTTNDLLRATGGLDVSVAGDYLAIINMETNGMFILPMIDGIPSITNRLLLTGFNTAAGEGRDVAFDIAGNLYAVSSGAGLLRVFSPGGRTTATTGSDGTFEIVNPPRVRVVATDEQGAENPGDAITFNIWREGSTKEPLTVTYTLTGAAGNGADYETNLLAATIPAGETNVVVVIAPTDDLLGEPTETVILTLASTPEYNMAAPARATGFIADNEPILALTMTDNFGAEAGANTITFNISRNIVPETALTVNYTLTGTASNGVDYATNELSAVIPAGQMSVAVVITPVDDAVAELTETIIANLANGADYAIGSPRLATAYIADNEQPVELRITATDTNAYERFPSDLLAFTITRYGDTNSSQFVLLEIGGTAQRDVDYVTLHTNLVLFMDAGFETTNFLISPLNDFAYEGDETVTLTIASNPGEYVVGIPGSATGRIQEDDYPPENIIFSDNLNADTSADWIIKFGANNGIPDYSLEWAYDYSANGIPPAPGSLEMDTLGLRMQVNKMNPTIFGSAAINLYANNQSFSGDYALRFDLYLNYGTLFATEHALGGINHSGHVTNRYSQSTSGSATGIDGVWVAIAPDGSNARDWAAYTGTNAAGVAHLITNRTPASLASIFTVPPFSAPGSPGNSSVSTNRSWADVELSQVGNTIALRVNKTLIYQFQNIWGFTNGTIMIGFNDQFDSLGSADNYAIFDNLRVVRLGSGNEITSVNLIAGTLVQLNFSSSDGGQPGDFHIESTSALSPPAWSEETGAVITTIPAGFRATIPFQGTMRFYRVRR